MTSQSKAVKGQSRAVEILAVEEAPRTERLIDSARRFQRILDRTTWYPGDVAEFEMDNLFLVITAPPLDAENCAAVREQFEAWLARQLQTEEGG